MKVTVRFAEKNNSGQTLYELLLQEGMQLSAPCAGKGCCRACRVKVLKGSLPPSLKDREVFSDTEIQDGWRLACQAYLQEDCTVLVPEERFTVLTGCGEKNPADENNTLSAKKADPKKSVYKIGIDLGTTTIVYELYDVCTNETIKTVASANSQRVFGSDVVSRMEQSNNGRKDLLKNTLCQQMKKDIAVLMEGRDPEEIEEMAISANTPMVHLLMGYSCEGLGKHPFTPVTLDPVRTDTLVLNLLEKEIPVRVTEGISAYVGGDILAGLASVKILHEKKATLFIDLGTNAEMALWNGRGTIYVTSAPAGPAFEAANISCGVGSIEGAVSGICIENGEQALRVIGDQKPIGFCGSGILEAVYELRRNDLMDETGLLEDEYFEKGYPVGRLRITQEDIRQIQLAKAAVYSAIAMLMQKAQITPEQIEQVYLAGGFGYYLNVEKAIGIGMIPRAFAGKIKAVGNASLLGTKEIVNARITPDELGEIKSICKEIYLANEKDFQEIFLGSMNFI